MFISFNNSFYLSLILLANCKPNLAVKRIIKLRLTLIPCGNQIFDNHFDM
jgi:hypothetical protein